MLGLLLCLSVSPQWQVSDKILGGAELESFEEILKSKSYHIFAQPQVIFYLPH